MTSKDKQDVIAICNILADKMSNGGKVAVQQIIDAVKDMVENEPCEDCISLNKLDDIITKAIDESENQTECQTLRWVLDVMSELPSVTPKTVADFADKCKECGKILNDKLKTKWIPVSERLPEEETDVLVCNGNGDIEVTSGSYSTELENYFMWYTSGWRFGEVIAWMPLPQPYKESECKDCYYNDGEVHAECVVCDKAESE